MDETRTIRYEGHPAVASALVQALKEEGVKVNLTRSDEARAVDPVTTAIVLNLVATGVYDAMKTAVSKFRERFPDAKADIEEEEEEES
jgi:hypothetical protein